MSSKKESVARTLTVALLVCLVCSVVVSAAAVALKPVQTTNRLQDKQRNILQICMHVWICTRTSLCIDIVACVFTHYYVSYCCISVHSIAL